MLGLVLGLGLGLGLGLRLGLGFVLGRETSMRSAVMAVARSETARLRYMKPGKLSPSSRSAFMLAKPSAQPESHAAIGDVPSHESAEPG